MGLKESVAGAIGGRSTLVILTIWLFILIATWVGVALVMAKRGLFYGA